MYQNLLPPHPPPLPPPRTQLEEVSPLTELLASVKSIQAHVSTYDAKFEELTKKVTASVQARMVDTREANMVEQVFGGAGNSLTSPHSSRGKMNTPKGAGYVKVPV